MFWKKSKSTTSPSPDGTSVECTTDDRARRMAECDKAIAEICTRLGCDLVPKVSFVGNTVKSEILIVPR